VFHDAAVLICDVKPRKQARLLTVAAAGLRRYIGPAQTHAAKYVLVTLQVSSLDPALP
jgi:hypothetical protein